MTTATLCRTLLIGRPSTWLDSATLHLRALGHDAEAVTDIDPAIARLRHDSTIGCVVLAESLPRAPWMTALSRIALVRPDLPVIVLASSYDPAAMADYLQLGQRDSGEGMVRYHPNDYDYENLSQLIHGACSGSSRSY